MFCVSIYRSNRDLVLMVLLYFIGKGCQTWAKNWITLRAVLGA